MTPIQVVGVGLDGAAGLAPMVLSIIQQAQILAGSDRLLQQFPDHPAQRWTLKDLPQRLQQHVAQPDPALVVVLTSGDPLFFGLGRQLLQVIAPEWLTFHPHVSSVQLAFSRAKLPWQDATVVSAHGRSLDRLAAAVKKGISPIAVLTDPENTPTAIARWLQSLGLPTHYRLWVCENLGGADEQVRQFALSEVPSGVWSGLNVVILQRCDAPPELSRIPLLGIPDAVFLSFRDRPGLMTKRAVRVQILAELALQPHQVIWDIGAGTGSVSVEIARLVPTGQVWAIECTTAGAELIRQNAARFQTPNLQVITGSAPTVLTDLPAPDRIFIGGSHGQLTAILTHCCGQLRDAGVIVIAFATLENQAELAQWQRDHPDWTVTYQQLALTRSVAVGSFTRWDPLNPVILATLQRSAGGQ
ncbi:bifunctional cobalt-precorrin-7 (C(5))-methyltransferase/cobalt-precorrin-6B (C(15))-methyltransferase [Leptolyngbya iicbica]|uniref:Bifunctional cobalt-precorrin-7 (C(5))-methyltransferase/cobalt-precorrin-6B (C(15))-methyltransferase n=2 Tax=Cyanophyceae TaxID=3028117 RepID=A0A4Q7EIV4_9CYAN|nr:bifunctional cobalt-precorrin-7 (C(5))-methyltransferase/cobalt-precorrin-6B (C(15))-methyltransferase [Leptolyngbya sp. LK]RZM81719.1 bifunctional cobalt-precorrin-7 (C(5))-methyltransferase/cobalt-precorrin-6B (C(15))-methyltransferase [Leptolyngbya sp. LK]